MYKNVPSVAYTNSNLFIHVQDVVYLGTGRGGGFFGVGLSALFCNQSIEDILFLRFLYVYTGGFMTGVA